MRNGSVLPAESSERDGNGRDHGGSERPGGTRDRGQNSAAVSAISGRKPFEFSYRGYWLTVRELAAFMGVGEAAARYYGYRNLPMRKRS